MKKRGIALLLCLVLLGLFSPAPASAAAPAETVVLKLGSNLMAVGDQVRLVDAANDRVYPFAENSRTLLPVSPVVAAFGGQSGWDAATNDVYFTLNGHRVTHRIGQNTIVADGKTVTMEIPSRAMNNRTYVPLRYVLEGLGLTVGYEPNGQYVAVSTGPLGSIASLSGTRQLAKALSGGASSAQGTLVSGTVDRGSCQPSYDTSSPSSAYIPDLGAATGNLLYRIKTGIYVTSLHYSWPGTLSKDEMLSALEAYVELLDSLPNFEVIQPFGLYKYTAKVNYYEAVVRYTGTAKMNNDLNSVVQSLDCNLYILYSDSWNSVEFHCDGKLQPVDTGHRISGAGPLSTQKAVGTRLSDAYYRTANGAYYNSSDGKLSARAGECAILVNGTDRYTGTVDFYSSSSIDELRVTGYWRDDEVAINFPKDRPMTGDVYTIDEFRQLAGEGRWRVPTHETAMMLTHEGVQGYPKTGPDSAVDALTVRILNWDKNGDTVLYFYAEATLNGQPYQIEGLAVANWRDADRSSSSSSGGDQDCLTCRGTGRCTTCGGSGTVLNWMPGTLKYVEQTCTGCGGSGSCRDCGGSGRA